MSRRFKGSFTLAIVTAALLSTAMSAAARFTTHFATVKTAADAKTFFLGAIYTTDFVTSSETILKLIIVDAMSI